MFWLYIQQCSDKSYYTGHPDHLENRLTQHSSKMIPNCYTGKRLPVQLMYSQECTRREEALASEKRIQGWSRRKKEALINGNWKALSDDAKRKNKPYVMLRDGANAPPQHERVQK